VIMFEAAFYGTTELPVRWQDGRARWCEARCCDGRCASLARRMMRANGSGEAARLRKLEVDGALRILGSSVPI
jgi:hypothetical protein